MAAGASAAAAPAPAQFRLSIVGTVHGTWDYTAAPVNAGGCERTVRSEAVRDVGFRTARSTLVRVFDGRVLGTTVRALAGTVTLIGATTTTQACGGQTNSTIADCVPAKRSFAGATLAASSTRPGLIVFGRVRNVRLRRSLCPPEPPDVTASPLGPIVGPLRVAVATLSNRRITRITLTATASRRKTYMSPEKGTLKERSVWRVTLVRVRS